MSEEVEVSQLVTEVGYQDVALVDVAQLIVEVAYEPVPPSIHASQVVVEVAWVEELPTPEPGDIFGIIIGMGISGGGG